MTGRTRPCDDAIVSGRLRKADQFLDAAETIREFADDQFEVGDAYVTLCVHAAIAAADVICCTALGEYAVDDNHNQAIALLEKVRPGGSRLASSLGALLGMKTRAGYGARAVTEPDCKRAQRQAERLVRAARDRKPHA